MGSDCRSLQECKPRPQFEVVTAWRAPKSHTWPKDCTKSSTAICTVQGAHACHISRFSTFSHQILASTLPSCLRSPLRQHPSISASLCTWGSALARQPEAERRPAMLTARMCQRRLGFAVQVAPSGVEHPQAGNGLWLAGQAEPGTVVALYPGIVYPPLHYKCACARTGLAVSWAGQRRAWARWSGPCPSLQALCAACMVPGATDGAQQCLACAESIVLRMVMYAAEPSAPWPLLVAWHTACARQPCSSQPCSGLLLREPQSGGHALMPLPQAQGLPSNPDRLCLMSAKHGDTRRASSG